MIKVIYNRRRHRLTAQGHACSGQAGHDLVCAAVSALVLTLASNVADLAIDGKARHPIFRLHEGDAWVSCVPAPRMGPVSTLVFDTVCSGFQLLQTLYPENIEYRTEG